MEVLKAAYIQSYADVNDAISFSEALNGVSAPTGLFLYPVRSIDGSLIKKRI